MRVLVIGAGAVGTVLGGRLAAAGHDIVMAARGEAVAAINARGLSVLGPGDDERVAAPARAFGSAGAALGAGFEPELVLVCVKSYDTPAVAAELAALWPPGTRAAAAPIAPVFLTLQNGVGNEEALAAAVGAGRVLGGAVTSSVSLVEPGVARQNTRGGVAVAPYAPGGSPEEALEAAARRCADAFAGAGLRARCVPGHQSLKWSKLLLNMWVNTTCAIVDLEPADVLAHPGLFAVEAAAFREAVRAVRRAGIPVVDLPGYPVRLVCAVFSVVPAPLLRATAGRMMGGARGEKLPSLLIDARRGRRRSEAEVLHGAVARLAEKAGTPAPVCAALSRTLAACLETGSRQEFAGRPDRLVDLVRAASRARRAR